MEKRERERRTLCVNWYGVILRKEQVLLLGQCVNIWADQKDAGRRMSHCFSIAPVTVEGVQAAPSVLRSQSPLLAGTGHAGIFWCYEPGIWRGPMSCFSLLRVFSLVTANASITIPPSLLGSVCAPLYSSFCLKHINHAIPICLVWRNK